MSAVVELNDRISSAEAIAADLVRRGRVAQEIFANADQARVDEAVRAIAWSLYQPEHAKELADSLPIREILRHSNDPKKVSSVICQPSGISAERVSNR